MIPIADNLPNRKTPVVTYLLVAVNVALFAIELNLANTGELADFLNTWGVVPARIVKMATDMLDASWIAAILICISMVLGLFLHSGFAHLIGNLLFLFVFGRRIEERLGHGQFLLFYFACGMMTSAIQVWSEPTLNAPLVGANGAIAGVLGAYLLSYPRAKIETIVPLIILFIPIELPALFYLFWWFVQQIFYGVSTFNIETGINSGSFAYWMHAVGLAIGTVLIFLLMPRQTSVKGLENG
ncbi:rhomboid family intramembrane serine protease [Leptolyngbya sp. FACHB-671]|uniref:rhomboid family intramembrane serine protease n=1 Tax=Leptolyngbya sp. FACHB-671 TaxID=2692812 RepID=UPI001687F5B5|nr:rhomboid family intramembrane serine protease [Leptolyngbya sp. FACHB-671]MBD2070452.1 rhomboid family intramembrane serine protease [Leptolyngbya sp. FACHB-671]